MTHEIIEKVAISIWQATPGHANFGWNDCEQGFKTVKLAQAKAAIEAMRDLYKCISGPLGNSSNDVILNGTIDIVLKE